MCYRWIRKGRCREEKKKYSHPSFIKYILEVFFHLPAVGDISLESTSPLQVWSSGHVICISLLMLSMNTSSCQLAFCICSVNKSFGNFHLFTKDLFSICKRLFSSLFFYESICLLALLKKFQIFYVVKYVYLLFKKLLCFFFFPVSGQKWGGVGEPNWPEENFG